MELPTQAIRAQLSMYVPSADSEQLEAIRRLLDPVQSQLIPAHVTLCREDELEQLPIPEIRRRLTASHLNPVTLRFGPPESFSGHGVLLPCIGGENEFHALRMHILGSEYRVSRPHITLAHPRNPKAPGNSMLNASCLHDDIIITFPTVSLIEQTGLNPWLVLETFHLPHDVDVVGQLPGDYLALSQAAASGDLAEVRRLLDLGVNQNIHPGMPRGLSPVMWAAARGHLSVVRLLVERGADLAITNADDDTAMSLAEQRRHPAVARFLRSHGAGSSSEDGEHLL